jgi:hypothetical protein
VGVRSGAGQVIPLLATLAIACSTHGAQETPSLAVAVPSPLAAAPDPANSDDRSRFPSHLAALAWETRVMEQPSASGNQLGYLRAGAIVDAASDGKRGSGCHGEWRAIAPTGYVCVEPGVATLDVADPMVRALSVRPSSDERLPYMYGMVRSLGPIYSRLPTLLEAKNSEWGFERRMRRWFVAKDDAGAGFRPEAWRRGKTDPTPPPLALWDAHATVEVPDWFATSPPGAFKLLESGFIPHHVNLVVGKSKLHNGFAFLDTAVVDGRRYGITTDLRVFPVDRMRPIEGSAFHGYRIPEDIDFPFALVRRAGTKAYELRDGRMVGKENVPRRSAIRLSGNQRLYENVLYFETADGLWLSETHVSRVDASKRLTKWSADGEHWIDVSIRKQVLVAYEGTKAVYATLVSTGEAGEGDPQTSKSTVQGEFRIFAKHLTTLMSSEVVGEEFELGDIPYVQYFEDGYALHAAYWHDDFGIPRSHGCINLSPEDAKWLFSWTEPQLPHGWHAVRQSLRGSVVVVHP